MAKMKELRGQWVVVSSDEASTQSGLANCLSSTEHSTVGKKMRRDERAEGGRRMGGWA